MNKNILIVIGALALVGLGVFVFNANYVKSPTLDDTENTEVENEETSDESTGDNQDATGTVPAGEPTITYTDDGFSPSELTIAVGTEVTFVNNSSRDFWPASAMHPTHTVYPGSNISKCGTADAATIFDACDGIAPGGTYRFTFESVGEWGYHDHLRASEFGKIIVLAD